MGKIRRRSFLQGLSLAAASFSGRARAGYPAAGPRPRSESAYFRATHAVGRVTMNSATVNLVKAHDRDVQLQIRVRWAESQEQLPTSPWVSETIPATEPLQQIELILSGLTSATEYWYRVEFEATDDPGVWQVLPAGRLRTQKPPGEEFEFSLLADLHWGDCFFFFDLRTVWGFNNLLCLSQMLAESGVDFCVDLGDAAYPNGIRSQGEALWHYAEYRRVMAQVFERMPVFYALGNHEKEAGFYQHGDSGQVSGSWQGNHLESWQYAQKWATHARLLFVPNPRGDTYPEGGEGAPGFDSAADWGAGDDPWNDGERSHLQNFYAWSWGDALFVVLDPFRYTLPGSARLPLSPREWRLGPTQMNWLAQTLAASSARWKFVIAHHQLGGGLIGRYGEAVQEWKGLAYGRGSAIEAARANTEQALVHALMRQHGAQFFLYAHDHCFCHSVLDEVHYIACGRAPFIHDWFSKTGMQETYGNVLIQGADRAWVRRLFTVLGYTRFRISPDSVRMDWIRTGYSFQPNVMPCFELDFPARDWMESWCGRTYAATASDRVEVDSTPVDVDGVRTLEGAQIDSLYAEPAGEDYYIQPVPTRPEIHDAASVALDNYPAAEHPVAVADYVPETVYSETWAAPTKVAEGPRDGSGRAPAGGEAIAGFSLDPNPTSGGTALSFVTLRELSHAQLLIHDAEGRLVQIVDLARVGQGLQSMRWDGRVRGRPASAGIYFLSIRHEGGVSARRKLVVVG